jgi:hypothetical protein
MQHDRLRVPSHPTEQPKDTAMHRAIVPFLLLAVLLSLLWACGEEPPSSGESGPSAAETQETATTEPAADAPEPTPPPR